MRPDEENLKPTPISKQQLRELSARGEPSRTDLESVRNGSAIPRTKKEAILMAAIRSSEGLDGDLKKLLSLIPPNDN